MDELPPEEPAPPSPVAWEPALATGHALIDAQHQALLAQCNQLAAMGAGSDEPAAAAAFDAVFARLKQMAREHFAAEAALLAGQGEAVLEDHRAECEEFEYLADEIATTANFSRLELQRFVALWCVGHVAGSARQLLAGPAA